VKTALEIVKENTLPGQLTTDSCVKSSDQIQIPEVMATITSKVYQVPVPLPEVFVVLIGRAQSPMPVLESSVSLVHERAMQLRPIINLRNGQPTTTRVPIATAVFQSRVYKPTVYESYGYDELPKGSRFLGERLPAVRRRS